MACDNFLFFGVADATSAAAVTTIAAVKTATSLTGDLKVVGESTDTQFGGSLEIKEFSFGVENPTTIGSTSGGAGAGKAKFNEFNVKKGVDLASPKLFSACGQGCHFPYLSLIIRKAGGVKVPYLIYQFQLVYVTKVEWSGGAGEEAPDEDVTFVYGAMQITYTQQDQTGKPMNKTQMEWSVVTNQPNMNLGTMASNP